MDKSILILEDEIDVARCYANCLKNNGYNPVLAYNGLEGLEKLEHMHPQIILLDLGMPKMNGIEFYQKLCGKEQIPKYPILVVTGRDDLETLFDDLHVDGFLMKPFVQQKLLAKMKTVLAHQYWRNEEGLPRKVVIVDNIDSSAKKIKNVLCCSGFKGEIIGKGLDAIDHIIDNPPDLAVISLGLEDLSGDLVILKLQGSLKTKKTQFILYIRKNEMHEKAVMEHFAQKTGVRLMCEYENPMEILSATENIFQEK